MARTVGSSLKDGNEPLNPMLETRAAQEAELTQSSFLKAVREIVAKRAEVKNKNEELKALRKGWKAHGIELKQLDESVRKAEWGRDEVRDYAERQNRYDGWLGLPIGGQADLFSNMSADAVQKQEWRNLGYTAGTLGLIAQAPETCPPEYIQDWLAGHAKADEAIWTNPESVEAQNEAAAEIPVVKDNVTMIAEAVQKKRQARKPKEAAEPQDGATSAEGTGEVIH